MGQQRSKRSTSQADSADLPIKLTMPGGGHMAYEVLIVFDGRKDGETTRYRITKP